MIYFHESITTYSSQHQNTQKNTAASRKKSPARSNHRETRASATQVRPVTTCRTNSRRRKANGQAPDICHNKHLKTLTGQTTYAKKEKKNFYRRPPRQSPTCLAIRVLTRCVCLLASLFSMYALNACTDYPTAAKKYSPTAPTKHEEPKPITGDYNIGKATTTGAATRDKIGTTGKANRRLPEHEVIETIGTKTEDNNVANNFKQARIPDTQKELRYKRCKHMRAEAESNADHTESTRTRECTIRASTQGPHHTSKTSRHHIQTPPPTYLHTLSTT